MIRRDAARGHRRDARAHARRTRRTRDGQFDLKQDRGGIADIEFLAQYWVLRHVREHPPLAEFADTIRHLESVGSAALVDHRVIDRLVDAYRPYRRPPITCRWSSGRQPWTRASSSQIRAGVAAVWERVMVAGEDPVPV